MQLKEKQEKFCQNYVLHKNATRAAKDAGYSEISAHNTGSRLLQDPLVQERLEELAINMTTSIDVVDEIEKQYDVARVQGQTTSALKALELLSRIRGNNIDVDEITTESLEQDIIKGMELIGLEKVLELMAQAFPEEIDDEEDESLLTTEELEGPSDSQ
jgi:phage terminase small subunit